MMGLREEAALETLLSAAAEPGTRGIQEDSFQVEKCDSREAAKKAERECTLSEC